MYRTLCILGRQAALGRAELESLYGSQALKPIDSNAAMVDLPPSAIDFSRLGGTVKFCKILTILDTVDWQKIISFLETNIPPHLTQMPEGKMKLGLSLYGLPVSVKQLNASALRLKNTIRSTGRSVRIVPNTELSLNSAQVLRNKLTSALGWELVLVKDGNQTILAQNIAEQDIDAYAKRDQSRPKRDARVGMLPPKLAQIIINLSGAQKSGTLWDPFCGTGVLLQEALLMGVDVYGSDIDPRMISYSQTNLEWLAKQHDVTCGGPLSMRYSLEVCDALNLKLNIKHKTPLQCIASETYLGRPLSMEPSTATLTKIRQDVDHIHKKFLTNIANQTKPGFRICIAVPAWHVGGTVHHLKTLDSLEELGYTRQSFVHADNWELVYRRPNQIVGRELVALTRI